jgi:hypothetical protein
MIEPILTRREKRKLTPEILGHYHDLLMANDFEEFDMLLEIYRVPEEQREEQRREFRLYAERILRRRWRGQR